MAITLSLAEKGPEASRGNKDRGMDLDQLKLYRTQKLAGCLCCDGGDTKQLLVFLG